MVICFTSGVILNSIALDLQRFQSLLKVSDDDIRVSPKKQAGTVDLYKYTSMSWVIYCVETEGKTCRHHQGWNTDRFSVTSNELNNILKEQRLYIDIYDISESIKEAKWSEFLIGWIKLDIFNNEPRWELHQISPCWLLSSLLSLSVL